MGACRFKLSQTNPNNQLGAGGCACSPTAHPDQCGPFAIFYATETEVPSPHNVVCIGCVEAIVAAAHDESEVLAAGEDDAPDEEDLVL